MNYMKSTLGKYCSNKVIRYVLFRCKLKFPPMCGVTLVWRGRMMLASSCTLMVLKWYLILPAKTLTFNLTRTNQICALDGTYKAKAILLSLLLEHSHHSTHICRRQWCVMCTRSTLGVVSVGVCCWGLIKGLMKGCWRSQKKVQETNKCSFCRIWEFSLLFFPSCFSVVCFNYLRCLFYNTYYNSLGTNTNKNWKKLRLYDIVNHLACNLTASSRTQALRWETRHFLQFKFAHEFSITISKREEID